MGSNYLTRETNGLLNGDLHNDDSSNLKQMQLLKNGSSNCNGQNGLVKSQDDKEVSNPSDFTAGTSNGNLVNGNSNGNSITNGQTIYNDSAQYLAPFPKLAGENILFSGLTTEGIIILTNYRLFMSYSNLKDASLPTSLPLGIIESIECRDLFYLYIYTKCVRSYICSFTSGEDCTIWYKKLIDICSFQSKIENLFCFKYYSATKAGVEISHNPLANTFVHDPTILLEKDNKRMGLTETNGWRISEINKEFKLCSSYPKYLIVPHNISDKDLDSVAGFRYSKRIPIAVWRHKKNGCIISRSSQPEVGWLGWRNNQDENLLQSFVTSCSTDDNNSFNKKLLVLDARSYAAAVANRAKGGGCECPEYYPSCEVQFMSLANIHSIRKSFHCIKYICESPADQFNWFTLLDNSKWLNNIASLLKSALIVVNAIDIEERPVLVHCSDGWDRTPQIVALAELMLDPYYRTIEGFQTLIEREWISYGHKFSDRCGHGPSSDDPNERCPVFLQWIDCVHQLLKQFPCSFEFNLHFLIKLIHHTYSCLYGTFIGNNMQERNAYQLNERSYPAWSYFNASRQHFINYVYVQSDQVLRPSCKTKDIIFWSEVYMPLSSSIHGAFMSTSINSNSINFNNITNNGVDSSASQNSKDSDSKNNDVDANATNETESDMETIASDKHLFNLSKTRSCENINSDDNLPDDEIQGQGIRTRHCSDPNLFRSLCNESDEPLIESNGKCADILKYLRDLQININSSLNSNREISDGEINQQQSNRDDHTGGALDDCDIRGSHFSMLSTETLLNTGFNMHNENHQNEFFNNGNNLLTTSTSTTEISNSCVLNNDWLMNIDKLSLMNNHSTFPKKKQQTNGNVQTPIDINNCTNGNVPINGNGKHTRTPSSGCPATPNDDQGSDSYQNEISQTSEVFDIDGQVLLRDKVQLRLEQIITQHKNEINALQKELYMARLALCQQLSYSNGNGTNGTNGIHDESQNNGLHSNHENGYENYDSWVHVSNPLTSLSSNPISKTPTTETPSFTNLNPSILESNCDRPVKCVSEKLERIDQLPITSLP